MSRNPGWKRVAALLAATSALSPIGCGGGSGGSATRPPSTPSAPHLTHLRCATLHVRLEQRLGKPLGLRTETSPPQSHCQFSGSGISVNVYLDAAPESRRRYANRMTEMDQFGAPDPAKIPHSVAAVGEPSAGEHDANWVPALNTLFALRGNRWLTVAYSVAGEPDAQLRAEAAELARRAFKR